MNPNEHDCDTLNAAVRLEGFWTLLNVETTHKMTRLFFKQGNECFAHVIFDTTAASKFEEGNMYNLCGWQKSKSRHNVLYFTS